jgi:hypothetical protein
VFLCVLDNYSSHILTYKCILGVQCITKEYFFLPTYIKGIQETLLVVNIINSIEAMSPIWICTSDVGINKDFLTIDEHRKKLFVMLKKVGLMV